MAPGEGEAHQERRLRQLFSRRSSPPTLSARWTLTPAASWQDVPRQEGDDDNCRRDGDDGDGGGGEEQRGSFPSLTCSLKT
jgi:hypothetical protein